MSEGAITSIAGIMLPMVLVPTIIALKHAQRKREWEHLERMKALELGRPVPGTEGWPAAAAIAIGAGVPICAFLFTWLARLTAQTADEVFIAPTIVSVAAVWVGKTLATRLLESRDHQSQVETQVNGKPAFDPDAFDVVGRRG